MTLSTAERAPVRVNALFALFVVSGFCGLIYESIWSHYLKLILGHAAYAQAVVLVVFVGGMALGAGLAGRWSERIRLPLLWYAGVEAIVALVALAFHRIFEVASVWAMQDLLPAMCVPGGSCSANWILACALILPPSILLGTTFPLMSAAVIRMGVKPGRGLAMLYFLNSGGAAFGVLCSGYYLIPEFGLPGTMLVAGSMNAAVAACAYAVARWPGGRTAIAAGPVATPDLQDRALLRTLLCVAALTGLSSFIYEVVWIRMLTLVLGAATHSFELMLATFILGLALGGWWIRNRIDGMARPLWWLGAIQILMGCLAMATLPLYGASFDGMEFVLQALRRSEQGFLLFNVASGLIACAVMLPAAICAGMTLPLITAVLMRRGLGERQIGQVYGINTLGAIAGVLLTVQILLPMAGMKWALWVGASTDVALGAWLFMLARRQYGPGTPVRRAWVPLALATSAAAFTVGVTALTPLVPQKLASGVYRTGKSSIGPSRSPLFHKDGKTATITVLETADGIRSLLTNGKTDGAIYVTPDQTTPDDHTVVLLGALGLAHHPAARRAAVIGLGTGITTSVLLESPTIESVETIEIEPLMLEAAQNFRPRNRRTLEDPRSHIVIDDARAHFAKTRTMYDIIVSEPSNPWVSGVSGLFTVEFYDRISRQLAPDGHFVQWLQLYEASPQMVGSILRAFAAVFPEFRAYQANDFDVLLVARNDGKLAQLDVAGLQNLVGLGARLEDIGIDNAATLAAHDVGRATALQLVFNSYGSPSNSDFYPLVDSLAARDRFLGQFAADSFAIQRAPVPVLEFGVAPHAYLGAVRKTQRYMPGRVTSLVGAWHGHRYLRGAELDAEEASLLEGDGRDYALVRSWLRQCSFPRATDAGWASVLSVASSLNPGLPPKMAGQLWRDIARQCGHALDAGQRDWLNLYAAVGERNATDSLRWSDALLQSGRPLSPKEREYAVLAALVSRLALGRHTQAKELWASQQEHMTPDSARQAWFRYLVQLFTATPGTSAQSVKAASSAKGS